MNSMYRVQIRDTAVSVVGLGLDVVDNDLAGVYSVESLPKLLEDRLAVLMTCDPTPPTHMVDGIGRRIDDNTFWIYK